MSIYFNQGYIDFFRQLHKNNTKEWFQKNKKWYELSVREPFKNLIEDLLVEVKGLDSHIYMEGKEALFRINNDLRFSKNRLPYKTHLAAGFSRGGRKSNYAGYFVQIGKDHILVGGGLPYLERESLRKIRIEIGYNSDKFLSLLQEPMFRACYGTLLGEKDQNLPQSFKLVINENPWIANKQFYYVAIYNHTDLIFRHDLVQEIMRHFRAGAHINNFLINSISNFSKPIVVRQHRKVMEF